MKDKNKYTDKKTNRISKNVDMRKHVVSSKLLIHKKMFFCRIFSAIFLKMQKK